MCRAPGTTPPVLCPSTLPKTLPPSPFLISRAVLSASAASSPPPSAPASSAPPSSARPARPASASSVSRALPLWPCARPTLAHSTSCGPRWTTHLWLEVSVLPSHSVLPSASSHIESSSHMYVYVESSPRRVHRRCPEAMSHLSPHTALCTMHHCPKEQCPERHCTVRSPPQVSSSTRWRCLTASMTLARRREDARARTPSA